MDERDEKEVTHVYNVRYCLSVGIKRVRLHEERGIDPDGYAWVSDGRGTTLLGRNDWARTPEEAVVMAKAKRNKKIASLWKQIAKVEAMKFDVLQDS